MTCKEVTIKKFCPSFRLKDRENSQAQREKKMTASSTDILHTRLAPQGEGKKVRSLLADQSQENRAGCGF